MTELIGSIVCEAGRHLLHLESHLSTVALVAGMSEDIVTSLEVRGYHVWFWIARGGHQMIISQLLSTSFGCWNNYLASSLGYSKSATLVARCPWGACIHDSRRCRPYY